MMAPPGAITVKPRDITVAGFRMGRCLVPRRGFDPLISTLKGWHPDLARRPGHYSISLAQQATRRYGYTASSSSEVSSGKPAIRFMF